MSDAAKPTIVLTDEDRGRATARDNCPRCDAPATAREQSNGFGKWFKELCGKCGFDFGMKERHG